MVRAEFVLETKMMRYGTHVADVLTLLKDESDDLVTLKSLTDDMELEVRQHTKSYYTFLSLDLKIKQEKVL